MSSSDDIGTALSHGDAAQAAQLATALVRDGLRVFRDELSVAIARFPELVAGLTLALSAPLCRAHGVSGRLFHLIGTPKITDEALRLATAFYGEAVAFTTCTRLADAGPPAIDKPSSLLIVRDVEQADRGTRAKALQALATLWAAGQAVPAPTVISTGTCRLWDPFASGAPHTPWPWMSELDLDAAASRWRAQLNQPGLATALRCEELTTCVALLQGRVGELWIKCCNHLCSEIVRLRRDPATEYQYRASYSLLGITDGSQTRGLFAPVAALRWAHRCGLLGCQADLGEWLARALVGDASIDHLQCSRHLLFDSYPQSAGVH